MLSIDEELGRGNYGVVCAARCDVDGVQIDAVAKRADAMASSDAQLAEQYLGIERLVNEEISSSSVAGFCRYLGTTSVEGSEWLLWERVRGEGEESTAALSLADFTGELGGTPRSLTAAGLEPRGVLRQVLLAVRELHELGFVHRDVKTANVLVDRSSSPSGPPQLRLIDMGSCAQVRPSGWRCG